MNTVPDPPADPLHSLRERDDAADAFERAWRKAERPDLRAFVGDLSTSAQRKLLEVLLPLDWDYRRDAGESPTLADYQALWPGEQKVIAEVVAHANLESRNSPGITETWNQHSASGDVTLTAPAKSTGPSQEIGGVIGDYELVRELGRGGMGVVFLARHRRLNRLAALKVMRSGVASTAEERQRFHGEAAAAAQLDHPGIVPVFEAGTHDSQHYLALAYVEGRTLWDRIKENPLPPREAASLMERVANAIGYAHARGIVHRDIKPQNILITPDGQPRVTDFGLAKTMAADSSLTATGQILGTPSYMAPEQAAGQSSIIGPSADIYALGATLYCTLSGRPPFQAATVWETLRLVQEQEPVPLREYNRGLDRDLETICLKCLQKSSLQRYASAADLADDLHRYLAGEPIRARRLNIAERSWRWCRRNPLVVAVMTSLVLLATVSTWAWVRQSALTKENTALFEQEKTQRERAELQLHYSQVARAATALDAKNYSGAESALDDRAPLEARGWDYRYLQRQLLGTPLSLNVPPSPVRKVAFSRDAKQLATGSLRGEVQVWNLETGQPEIQFDLQGGTIAALHFHPTKPELIAASLGGMVGVWGSDSPTAKRIWQAHPQRQGDAALHPDGSQLATCSADGKVKVWNLETGKELLTFNRHTFPVQCVAFHPDGSSIASAAASGNANFELKHWNAATGELIEETTGKFHSIQQVIFSPDGARLATVIGQGVSLWSRDPLKEEHSFGLPGAITSLSWSPDGTQLATASLDGVIRVWDAVKGEQLRDFGHHAEETLGTAFSPDGYQLASASGRISRDRQAQVLKPGQVKLWDLRIPADEANIAVDERNADPVTNYLNAVAYQPGTNVVATGGWRKVVRLVDVATGLNVAPEIPFGGVLINLEFHPTEPILLMAGTNAGANGGLALYDVRTQKITPLRGHTGGYLNATLSSNGEVVASAGEDRIVKLWETRTGKELKTLTGHTAPVSAFSFAPDGNRIFSSARIDDKPEETKVWDVRSGRELTAGSAAIKPGPLSPDGKYLASRDPDGAIQIWNTSDQSLRHVLRGHLGDVPGLTFTPDGKRLISSSRDRTIRIWDHREGIEVLRIALTTDVANDVAVSSDGTLLACATQLGAVRIFDARGVPDALSLSGHTAEIESYGFTPDGRLVSRDQDGTLLEWTLPAGEHRVPDETIDPTPLPAESSDGQWAAEVDRRDISILRVIKRPKEIATYNPWQEAFVWHSRRAPVWHAEDADAAEKRGDWYAAAFHLTRLNHLKPDDADVSSRLERALGELKSRSLTPPADVIDNNYP